jgi:hypothetical protein
LIIFNSIKQNLQKHQVLLPRINIGSTRKIFIKRLLTTLTEGEKANRLLFEALDNQLKKGATLNASPSISASLSC